MSKVREMHGVDSRVSIVELTTDIRIKVAGSELLTPDEARYLASKLYRLARRIDARAQVPA